MKYLVYLLLSISIISCGPSNKELASRLIGRAQQLKDEKKFNNSKNILDSLKSAFPKEREMVVKANILLKDIAVLEQQRDVFYTDSLLVIKQKELKPLLVNFVTVVDEGGDTLLIHTRQRPENSYHRSYVRANLNSRGDFYLSTQYVGENNINHTNMRAVCGSLTAQSDIIKEDGFANRRFEDEDTKWEVICFKNGADNGISDLIASHSNQEVRVEFLGGSAYTIYLESYDKEAIRDGYEISFVLKEIAKLKQSCDNSKRTLLKLQRNN